MWAGGVGVPRSLTPAWGPFDGKLQPWLLCAWCPHVPAMNMQIAIHCLQHRPAQQRRGEVVLEASVRGAKTGMGALEKKKIVMTLRLKRQPVFQGILEFISHQLCVRRPC